MERASFSGSKCSSRRVTPSPEPAVLVHGWGTNRRALRPLFEYLQSARRVVSVDLRGFGESDAPDQSYTVEGFADDVSFIASELGLDKPVVIGHSMGGLVALEVAARHCGRLSAAVILESMVAASEAVVNGLRPILDGVRTKGYRQVVAGLMNYLTGVHFDETERASMVGVITSCPQNVLASSMEAMIDFDSTTPARRVSCPLLYVGTSTTYADLTRFREIAPQLVTGQLVGCAHYFPLEVPDQLNPMIGRFLRTRGLEAGMRASDG